MRLLFLFAFALLYINGYSQKNNFGGNWKLDIAHSDFGGQIPGQAAPKTIVIALLKDSLQLERDFEGSGVTKEVLPLNSKPITIDLSKGAVKTKKETALEKSTDDHQIVIHSTYTVDDQDGSGQARHWQYTRTETYRLSEDKSTLTLERITVVPDRTDVIKAVYTQ
ncbi:MAG: hypothetical protein J0H29_01470 [Sphingobacteriales bacterium]|nr:hypothetical protein [Sphingobacteriales bacterium]OJY89333.1 MAG: hypothetical protein BGP14_05360 [Sphingobacteriales bacterium 44-15]